MLKEERFDHIINLLKKENKVSYDQLAGELHVSEDTIRRDIDALYQNGLLSKVRGGAITLAKNPLSFQDRSSHLSEGKEAIALKARQFIKNGQTIFMDGGTTVCAIAASLPLDSNLRVITNNMALIPILSNFKNIEVIVLGGKYNRDTQTNSGLRTIDEAREYIADCYFMGACALHHELGVTSVFNEEASIKRAMISNAKKIIVLGNVEKLSTTEPFRVCDLAQVNVLITDLPSDSDLLDSYRSLGIRLI
ncbi:DeoR/GlpR family DNA-binding transcription regulator [Pedobacter antarcticus]|uniref:DeoR/GlpR family DNA-binding transcription regulator n=1 Tax=Pedobacter antarcticus TaxID=34086 RepID=UPI00087E59F1|nr:DeoR/GlpR family DNA-binding transcription regulator [Pedobacter antarcticus]SDM50879.1 transcriptional regulator, DeoR family [Pedobacter antarcticus]